MLVTSIDTRSEHLALYLSDQQGRTYRSFDALAQDLARRGQQLAFAMNAGMYESDGEPVGLLVIDGKELAPLNVDKGVGNFFLQPNGVFAQTRQGPRVVTTANYPAIAPQVLFATQSGPMLLIDGAINPAFSPTSNSRYVRNGVCAKGDVVLLAISEAPVTFYEFASYFKDVLHCRDALYLDGSVSSVFQQGGARQGAGTNLGPMLGVVR